MPGSRETEKPIFPQTSMHTHPWKRVGGGGGVGGESLLHPLLKQDVREVQRPLLPPNTPTT